MNQSPILAFDCFGTVFDMTSVPREEIKAYVDHVRQQEWSPYTFPESWRWLTAHPDSAEGIYRLQQKNIECWTFSNGGWELIGQASHANDIHWNNIVDLSIPKVYKPNAGAYQYLRDLAEGRELHIVTANPTFGDIEGAELIGVKSHVIRHGNPETIIELAEMFPAFEKHVAKRNSDAHRETIKVKCSNCFGIGHVFYAPGHTMVKLRQAVAWKTYVCPICQGDKFLLREVWK